MWYIPPGNPYNKKSCYTHFLHILLKRRSAPHFNYFGPTATQLIEIVDNPSFEATYSHPTPIKLEKLTSRTVLISEHMKRDLSLTMISNHFETDN